MYTVELYLRVRLACHVDGLSQREVARRYLPRARVATTAAASYLSLLAGAET